MAERCVLPGWAPLSCRFAGLCYLKPNTMLDVWLIPALIILAVIIAAFYLLIKFTGGSGVRTEGRTLVDKPSEEENPPPSLPLS